MPQSEFFRACIALMRLDKPIGILLLLWPTCWGLWLASGGMPSPSILCVFILGVIIMRSAGCIMNDMADRNFDRHVKRTQHRPLAKRQIHLMTAFGLLFILLGVALLLLLQLNALAMRYALGALMLAMIYPLMKRYTHWPQVILGAAFNSSILMAYAAIQNKVPSEAWLLFVLGTLWTVIYDTMYAMVDRDDDLKIGVKSTAILFGEMDVFVLSLLHVLVIIGFVLLAKRYFLGVPFYISLVFATALAIYQLYLIKDRDRERCFKAFLNNHWYGMVIWLGIALQVLN